MMDQLIQIFKALSDKNRLRIVKMLEQKSMCVCEITEILQLANSTVSKHLSILKNAGLIVSQKEGRWINYKINPESDKYVNTLEDIMKDWINDDPVIVEDREKVYTVDRNRICSS
jgi:ArsR family transcriptional regulator